MSISIASPPSSSEEHASSLSVSFCSDFTLLSEFTFVFYSFSFPLGSSATWLNYKFNPPRLKFITGFISTLFSSSLFSVFLVYCVFRLLSSPASEAKLTNYTFCYRLFYRWRPSVDISDTIGPFGLSNAFAVSLIFSNSFNYSSSESEDSSGSSFIFFCLGACLGLSLSLLTCFSLNSASVFLFSAFSSDWLIITPLSTSSL